MADRNDKTGFSSRKNQNGQPEFIEKLINLNRVAKVQKGGRRFAFSALVVVGDGAGKIGFEICKALDVSEAIRKAMQKAKRNLVNVELNKNTIPHPISGVFKCTKVRLLPAAPGTGVIAGGAVRAVMEAAGIQDILAKTYGSRNDSTVIQAVINGLQNLWSPRKIARDRKISLPELWG